jgi:chromosome segregation ATPase
MLSDCFFSYLFLKAKQRDELINKGRREEIETNIKQLERKIEDIKLGIARDNEALQYLRGRVEKQSEISMLREQTAEELSSFKLKLDASRFDFRQCSIDVPTVELDEEGDGRDLVEAMQRLIESVETKHRRTRMELEKVEGDLSHSQQILSEKSALLSHNQQMADTLRRRMEALESQVGSVGIVKKSLNENSELVPSGMEVTKPQMLLGYFDQKLQQIDADLEKVETRPENTIAGLLKLAEMVCSCVSHK